MKRVVTIKDLKWTPEFKPVERVPYDHRIAETPFGRFLLTWKSWKREPWQSMDIGFDESPWGIWYENWSTPEEAMQAAQDELGRRIASMLA